MAIKQIFVLLLTLSPLMSLNGMAIKEQKDSASLGLALLYKLYNPHKVELTKIRKNFDLLLNKLLVFSAEIETLASIPAETKQRFTIKIEKKIKKTEALIAQINSIIKALANCPTNLKTERAQNALVAVATRFLGENRPTNLIQKAHELLELGQELLKKVQNK